MAEFKTALLLSPEEKRTLIEILCHVGGNPTMSKRRYADSIRQALDPKGMVAADWRSMGHYVSGSVIFKSQ